MFFNLFKKKEAVATKKIKIHQIGVVIHYYNKISVAIVEIQNDFIALEEVLFIKGKTTRFRQRVKSIEYEHQKISKAPVGYQIGLQVGAPVAEGDIVYKEI